MTMLYSAAQAAADIHYHLVSHEAHGYTQGWGRWGTDDICYVESQGIVFPVRGGDRDCSSSVIDAWKLALLPTAYAWSLDAATYTGDMRAVFANSGLFMVYGIDYPASRGDVYLNDAQHTAMVQWENWLSEFLISENGTIYGQIGDQTGSESVMRPWYNFPWNCLLHYNGGADTVMNESLLYEIRDAILAEHQSAAANWGDTSNASLSVRVDWIDFNLRKLIEQIDKLLGAIKEGV